MKSCSGPRCRRPGVRARRVGGGADAVERVAVRPGRCRHRERVDDRGAVAVPGEPAGATAPCDARRACAASLATWSAGARRRRGSRSGSARPAPMPGALERRPARRVRRRCRLSVFGVRRGAELQVRSRAERQRDQRRPARPAATQRRRTTQSAQRVQARLARSSVRRCGQSSRRPNVEQDHRQQRDRDSDADQRDQHARRSRRCAGTGRAATISASRPIATVMPLNTTARPAVAIARMHGLVTARGRGRAPRASATTISSE